MCIERSWKMGMRDKGVRENNGRGWTDQSIVYPQWGNTEKPLW
jgi:hypothetical protein